MPSRPIVMGLEMHELLRLVRTCTTIVLFFLAASPRMDVGAQDDTDATPSAQDGTVLYEADWSTGLAGWTVDAGWDVFDGMLIFDGSAAAVMEARPPYELGDRFNYAVEAEMQLLDADPPGSDEPGFGLFARRVPGPLTGEEGGESNSASRSGYWAILTPTKTSILPGASTHSTGVSDTEWHTYRLEVEGTTIRLFRDGTLLLEDLDNQYRTPGITGLFCMGHAQINVRGFRVIAL
jgi:hypothetical protein